MTHKDRKVSVEIKAGNSEVTRVGNLIRRLKIDELPQLLNVLIGDISFVGPRPPMPEQLDILPDWALPRLSVRPGLTGLAQVNGGIFLSWEERWRYDVQYVNRLSVGLDLWCLFRTIFVILKGEEAFLCRPPETV
jgi:lipopolysaccharide/colanic/teichoic acid biosynthesis glycosyltransferase